MGNERRWKPEEDALLGTCSDNAVAKRIGVSQLTVKRRRQNLGIPMHEGIKVESAPRFLKDPELNAKLDELMPFLVQEFNRRGVPVRDVDDRTAIEFLVDQALSAFKKSKTRSLYSKDET